MSKQSTLEKMLESFSKNEALRASTEALKPRLETEINTALATGEALDEGIAVSLQTKRAQIELCSNKLTQIASRTEELIAAIQVEFNSRFQAFDSELQALEAATKKKVLDVLGPLVIDQLFLEELTSRMIWGRTKLAVELAGLRDAIQFQVVQQNIILAARELLKRERDLELIKARP